MIISKVLFTRPEPLGVKIAILSLSFIRNRNTAFLFAWKRKYGWAINVDT